MEEQTFEKDLGKVVGTDGITPHIGENGNWFFGEKDSGVGRKRRTRYRSSVIPPPRARFGGGNERKHYALCRGIHRRLHALGYCYIKREESCRGVKH